MSEPTSDARSILIRLEPVLTRVAERLDAVEHGMASLFEQHGTMVAQLSHVAAQQATIATQLAGVVAQQATMAMQQTKMEQRLGEIATRQEKTALDLAELKGRVSQLPTNMQMIGFVLAVLIAGGVMKHLWG